MLLKVGQSPLRMTLTPHESFRLNGDQFPITQLNSLRNPPCRICGAFLIELLLRRVCEDLIGFPDGLEPEAARVRNWNSSARLMSTPES